MTIKILVYLKSLNLQIDLQFEVHTLFAWSTIFKVLEIQLKEYFIPKSKNVGFFLTFWNKVNIIQFRKYQMRYLLFLSNILELDGTSWCSHYQKYVGNKQSSSRNHDLIIRTYCEQFFFLSELSSLYSPKHREAMRPAKKNKVSFQLHWEVR